MISREIIMERLKTANVTVGTSRTPLTAAVGEAYMRNVVDIVIVGDGETSRTVTIEVLQEDGTTYTAKYTSIPVAPSEIVHLNPNPDIENPIMVLEGGTRPYGTVNAGSGVNVTIIYWDNDVS